MKTLLLIDAHALIHRAYHALPPLTTPDGRPSQALYGVASILIKTWKTAKPDYVAALFDRPEPTFRKEVYKEYKAQRPKAADELVSQLIEARKLFEAFQINVFELPGFEADDLIATFAERFYKEKDVRVVILTGDLDTLQLVRGEKVVVQVLKKGVSETSIYDEAAVKERFGLRPDQLADFKALSGDPSDNIKGVPGIGPKTASTLLQKYGDLETLYRRMKKDEKKRDLLLEYQKEAEEAKGLTVLRRDAPVSIIELQELQAREDWEKVREYLQIFDFKSLVERLPQDKNVPRREKEGSLFSVPATPSLFSDQGEKNLYLLSEEELSGEKLKRATSPDFLKVGFGLKNFLKQERARGQNLVPPFFDLGVAFWLLNPDFKTYDPESIFSHFLARPYEHEEASLKMAYDFARAELKKMELEKVFYEIEMPLLEILSEMELRGVKINLAELKKLEKKIEKSLEELSGKIYKEAGREFNINSSQQLGAILFDVLKLSVGRGRKTPGGKRSTNAAVLETLKEAHPIVPLLLEYREDFKIQTTYVKALQKLSDKDDRLHTEFVQTGAATGRLSSQNPNLQNIPRESEWSTEVRRAFEAEKNFTFVAFDYSQIELRLLAALSEDPGMLTAFREGRDIHTTTAARIFKVDLEAVQPEMRRVAKTLNFGLIYGMGASAFAQVSGVTRTQASQFITAYFEEFPRVKVWQEEVKRFAKREGYVKTLLGRRRWLPAISSSLSYLAAAAEREAINHPIQGLDADINKLAMVASARLLRKKNLWNKEVRLLLSIHDELLFEIHDDIMDTIIPVIQETMEQIFPEVKVPLKVEVLSGKNWGALQSLRKK